MNSPDAGPVAHNTERTSWSDLPVEVKATIAAQAGGSIVHAASTTGGFSPGFAGIVTLESGEQQFVKAASASRHPHSIGIARSEIASHQCLPPQTPTAKLLWHLDDGDWALAAFN